MVTKLDLEGNVYFINQEIKTLWELCLFILRYAPREKLMMGTKLLFIGFLLIMIISFSQGRYDAFLLVLYFLLGLTGMFFLRWSIYYQIYRNRYVSFRGYEFSYKNKRINFQQITRIRIHNNSNMTLVLKEFPYGYMFVGYGQDFYNQLIKSVQAVQPNIEVIED